MALESHTFESGLQLHVDHVPHARSTYASVYVGVGSAYETREEAGMAHLLEHAVFLGTKNFNTEEKLCVFADNGRFWSNAYTQHLHTEYVTQGSKMEPMIEYLGDVITQPLLRQRPMQGELEVVRQELNLQRSDLETVGDTVSEQLHFEEPHGRPVIGLMERLEHKARGIREFYHRTYNLGSMAVILSGSATIEKALPLVQRYFEESPLASKERTSEIIVPKAKVRPGGIYGFLVEGVESARISVSNPLPEELTQKMSRDMVPYSVARELFSVDVYNSMRIRRHLSYAGAFTLTATNQCDAWLSGGYATVNPENVQRGLKMLDSTVRATLPTTEQEHLMRRIRSCAGEAAVMLDSLSKRVDSIISRLDWGVPPVDPEKLANQYIYLSPKRVMKAVEDLAQAYENAPRVTLVTGGKDAVKNFEPAVANF